jgi:hypothetical protein
MTNELFPGKYYCSKFDFYVEVDNKVLCIGIACPPDPGCLETNLSDCPVYQKAREKNQIMKKKAIQDLHDLLIIHGSRMLAKVYSEYHNLF